MGKWGRLGVRVRDVRVRWACGVWWWVRVRKVFIFRKVDDEEAAVSLGLGLGLGLGNWS